MSTRIKILDLSLKLLNQHGIANVSIREISDKAGISPGNLTYHFKKKDAIIMAIQEQMTAERDALQLRIQQEPTIANVKKQLPELLGLYRKYRFFYLDVLELVRNFPKVAKVHRKQVEDQVLQIRGVLQVAVLDGNLKKETKSGSYDQLAHIIWMVLTFWFTQSVVRGGQRSFVKDAEEAMWSLLEPYLTERGRVEVVG